jgi:ribonuclease-3
MVKPISKMEKYKKIDDFIKKHNLKSEDRKLYIQAFTHRSFDCKTAGNNERLEFLGDAVLELIITDYLFKSYPDSKEGFLSQLRGFLVSAKNLSDFALNLKLDDIILLGKGEENNGGRRKASILSDTAEAIIGAVYISQGFEKTREFCLEYFANQIDKLIHSTQLKNPKTRLQEFSQAKYGVLPDYQVLKQETIDGERYYIMYLRVETLDFGPVRKNSKKEAEEELATIALNFFEGL